MSGYSFHSPWGERWRKQRQHNQPSSDDAIVLYLLMSPNMWKLLEHQTSNTLVEKVIQSSSSPWHHCLRWVTGVTCPREISMILSVSRFALSTSPHILDSGSSTISQVNVREDDTNDDAESCCLSLSCVTWTWQLVWGCVTVKNNDHGTGGQWWWHL